MRNYFKTCTVSLFCFIALSVNAEANAAEARTNAARTVEIGWDAPLVWVQIGLLLIVGVVLPYIALNAGKEFKNLPELRGLNLPRGSVRALLALLIVGSFVNVLLLGSRYFEEAAFDNIITAFSTLTGSVTAFYFATRAATPSPPPPSGNTDQGNPGGGGG